MKCNIQTFFSFLKSKIMAFFSWFKRNSDKTLDAVINYFPIGKLVSTLLLLGVCLFILLAIFAPFMSAFGSIIVNVSLALFILWVVDKFVLIDVNTVEELKKGNIAYALFWIGISIIIHAAISAS